MTSGHFVFWPNFFVLPGIRTQFAGKLAGIEAQFLKKKKQKKVEKQKSYKKKTKKHKKQKVVVFCFFFISLFRSTSGLVKIFRRRLFSVVTSTLRKNFEKKKKKKKLFFPLLYRGCWHQTCVVRSTAGTARYRSDAKRHPFSGLVDSAGELLHTP